MIATRLQRVHDYLLPALLFLRMLITLVVFWGLIQWFHSPWPSPVQALHQMVVGSLIHAAYLGGVFAAIEPNNSLSLGRKLAVFPL